MRLQRLMIQVKSDQIDKRNCLTYSREFKEIQKRNYVRIVTELLNHIKPNLSTCRHLK